MTAIRVIRESLHLLSRRDRWLLALMTTIQMATGFLDLLGIMLLGLVSVLAIAVVSNSPLPALVQSTIDQFGLQGVDPIVLAAWFCIAAGVALGLKTLISALLTRRTLRFLANRQAALSAQLTAALLSRPLLEIQSRASQDIAFVITIATRAATVSVLGAASTAVADVSLLVVLGLGLTAIDPTVTLFAAIFFGGLGFLLQRLLSGWASRLGREAADVDIESYKVIQEAINAYREVIVADRRSLYVSKIQDLRWRSARVSADSQFVALVPKYVFESALVVGALALAISQVVTKDVAAAVGIVAVFLVAGSRIMPAIMRLQAAGLTIRSSEAPAQKAFDLARDLGALDRPHVAPHDPSALRRQLEGDHIGFLPHVSVHDVWLRYPGTGTPALCGVSFEAAAGSSVALVGSTGAGKSTLADVLLGVVDPDKGRATIGGLLPAEAIRRWPGGVAYVPQEVALVNGTVRDNVAIGLPREVIADDRIWDALTRARLADFLRDSRDGLETLIGENGVRLSGGQRQRLGVARALFTRPLLLVLDEATSALDAETEQAIATTMRSLEGFVTTITVAHRLATVRHCDLVLYIERGSVLAHGTFDEVRAQSPAFDRQAELLGL